MARPKADPVEALFDRFLALDTDQRERFRSFLVISDKLWKAIVPVPDRPKRQRKEAAAPPDPQ